VQWKQYKILLQNNTRSGDRILAGERFAAPIQTGSGAHSLSCTIDVTWLVTIGVGEGGAKSAMGITKFNLRSSQVKKIGKIGLNQSLIYIYPFPPLPSNVLFAPLQHNNQKKTILKYKKMLEKILGGHLASPPNLRLCPVQWVVGLFPRGKAAVAWRWPPTLN